LIVHPNKSRKHESTKTRKNQNMKKSTNMVA
jgi:hypothetical protein